MSATPSPGPWWVSLDHWRRKKRERMAIVATPNGRMAIDCTDSGENYMQDCANARLVAAAPDLLGACQLALDLFRVALRQFNWNASALNAEAIALLNDVPLIVGAAMKKAGVR